MADFSSLNDFVLPPPLPALVALLLVLGAFAFGDLLARRLRGDRVQALDRAAGFVAVTAGVTALAHAAAVVGWQLLLLLRLMGGILLVAGLAYGIFLVRRRGGVWLRRWQRYWAEGSWLDRAALAAATVVGVAITLAVLGPATDIDSFVYHLGTPVEWLRQGGATPRPDWLHARLVGLGEMINMLGLAVGTDSAGAVFQAAGLLVLLAAVLSFAQTRRDRLFGAVLVMGCPLLVFLAPVQKPLLLPIAAVVIALVLLVHRRAEMDAASMGLAFTCALFAVGSKYNFILSGSPVFLLGLIFAWQAGRLRLALVLLVVLGALIVLPVWGRNLAFYGDPLSPLLERFMPDPDPIVQGFGRELRLHTGEDRTPRLLRIPLRLVYVSNPGRISTILGLGALVWILMLGHRRIVRPLVVAAALTVILTAALGQLTPRFFLEPYLWGAAVGVAASWGWFKRALYFLVAAQTAVVVGLAAILAGLLLPGALTPALRDQVMLRYAYGYAESVWLDEVLPDDVVILATTGAHALLPRPFVGWAVHSLFTMEDWPPAQRQQALTTYFPRDEKVVISLRVDDEHLAWFSREALLPCLGEPLTEPASFTRAVRNPYNVRYYQVQVFPVIWDAEGCIAGSTP